MVVISPPRFFSAFCFRFFLRKGQDSRLAVLMLSRPGQQKKTEGLQYQKPKCNVPPGHQGNFSHCEDPAEGDLQE